MSEKKQSHGILFVLSAPSGAGKTTLTKHAVELIPHLRQSISFTTRPIRSNEVSGQSYHFVDNDTFEEMVQNDKFVEWVEVHGNRYGTTYESLESVATGDTDLLLVIDIQGAAKLREKKVNGVYIFLLPPSLEELARRLSVRGTENDAEVSRRLDIAEKEIGACVSYDYIIVNEHLKDAHENLQGIILAERCRRERLKLEFPDYTLPPLT